MFLSKLLIGGALFAGCGVPLAFELLKGSGFKSGEFIFKTSGGA